MKSIDRLPPPPPPPPSPPNQMSILVPLLLMIKTSIDAIDIYAHTHTHTLIYHIQIWPSSTDYLKDHLYNNNNINGKQTSFIWLLSKHYIYINKFRIIMVIENWNSFFIRSHRNHYDEKKYDNNTHSYLRLTMKFL